MTQIKLFSAIKNLKFIITILTVLMLITNISFAGDTNGSGSALVNVVTDKIHITNNGDEYTQAAPAEYIFTNVSVSLLSPAIGRIKSWKTWLYMYQKNVKGSAVSFSDTAYNKSYPKLQRPKDVNTSIEMTISPAQYSELFTYRCNQLANTLRNQGYTNQQIFSQDREIEFVIGAKATNVVTAPYLLPQFVQGVIPVPNFTLVCKKSSGPTQPTAGFVKPKEHDVKVVYSSLTVIEKTSQQGDCKVTLSGVIKTDKQNGKVKFKYKHHPSTGSDIKWSDEYEVTTGQSKTAMFSHEFDVPIIIGEESGIMQIIGTDPEFESIAEHYAMNCIKAPASSLQQPLPPKLEMQMIPQKEITMSDGQICPSELLMAASITSKNTEIEGDLFFYNNTYQSEQQAINIGSGKWRKVVQVIDLSWDQFTSTTGNTGTYAVEGANNITRSQPITMGYSVMGDNYQAKFNYPPKTTLVKCRTPNMIMNLPNQNKVKKANPDAGATIHKVVPAQPTKSIQHQAVPEATIVEPASEKKGLKRLRQQ